MNKEQEPDGSAWGSMRVMLGPGRLLVARQGRGMVIADPSSAPQEATTDRLVELCAGAGDGQAASGADLVRSAAALVGSTPPPDVPALGLVAVESGDLLVMLTPGMRVLMTDVDGSSEVVTAEDSVLPVSRVIGGGVVAVALGPDPERMDVDRRSNLADGVVRAGGMLLEPGLRAVEQPMPAETMVNLSPPPLPTPAAPVTFTTFPLHDEEPESVPAPTQTGGEEVEQQGNEDRDHADLPSAPAAFEDVAAEDVMVRGIVCSRGHFNPPDARFCERCGISTVHQTHNVVTGVRPPLGVLVLDDGTVHALSQDLLIGRAPEEAEDARSGRCAVLTLDDPELSLSRTHARLVLDGWEIRVEDAGSVNGTFMAEPGSDDWVQLEANRPTTISVGARLRMGSRILAYESHHRG